MVAVEEATTSSLEELVAVIEGGGGDAGYPIKDVQCVHCQGE